MSYDPCYHQACDSPDPIGDGADADLYTALNAAYGNALEYNGVISNVNTKAFEEMADAIAHAILTYAMSSSSVSGRARDSDRVATAGGEGSGRTSDADGSVPRINRLPATMGLRVANPARR